MMRPSHFLRLNALRSPKPGEGCITACELEVLFIYVYPVCIIRGTACGGSLMMVHGFHILLYTTIMGAVSDRLP